ELLPSPKEVPPVTGVVAPGKGDGEPREEERPAEDDAPFAALAFKVMADPYVGKLTYFRVYSGKLAAGSRVLNVSNGRTERIGRPQVAYRATIRKAVAKVEGRFVRQTGGRGQYGHVVINVEPAPEEGFDFVNRIKGGSIPSEFLPAVEQGIEEALENGVKAGYPMVDVRVELIDGSYHDVDSSETAFKLAGSMALQEGARRAKPVLLEPVMSVEVVTPEEFLGEVIGDLSR